MKVAVGVIFDVTKRILITRRSWDKPHGGYWEFPGGKLLKEEDPKAALVRELYEEVGIQVVTSHYLGSIEHHYADQPIQLIVFTVPQFIGEPICCESQIDLRWVTLQELCHYSFPEANLAIIDLIQAVH